MGRLISFFFQTILCSTIGLDCHRQFYQNSSSSCPVACEGLYADVRQGWGTEGDCFDHISWLCIRSLVTEDKQKDRETLALLTKEYELYKDQWGLNLKYSQGEGERKNYSKFIQIRKRKVFKTFSQLPRSPWTFKLCTSSLTALPLTKFKRMPRWPLLELSV